MSAVRDNDSSALASLAGMAVRRVAHAGREKDTRDLAECANIPPEVIEVIRLIVREELKKDRQHRRRALLAEVDSINRELGIK